MISLTVDCNIDLNVNLNVSFSSLGQSLFDFTLKYWICSLTWSSGISSSFVFSWWEFDSQTQI